MASRGTSRGLSSDGVGSSCIAARLYGPGASFVNPSPDEGSIQSFAPGPSGV
jgi:hypothetical protein